MRLKWNNLATSKQLENMPEGTMGTKRTMTLGKVEETSASSQQGLNIFQLGGSIYNQHLRCKHPICLQSSILMSLKIK